MDVREALQRSDLFRDLPLEDRTTLASMARQRRHPSGAYLWRSGDAEDGVYLVLEGSVQIQMIGPEGEELVLHIHGPGDTLGEPGVYSTERDRKTDARARSILRVAHFAGDPLRALFERSPAAMRSMVRRLSDMSRGHSRRIAQSAFHDARQRLARLILDLADNHSAPHPRGVRITLPLSQRLLGGLSGLRRESVNRLLATFATDGAIAFDETGVTVLKRDLLEQAAGEE